jgi:O-antigen ligase
LKENSASSTLYQELTFYIFLFIIPFYGGGRFGYFNLLFWIFFILELVISRNNFRFKTSEEVNYKDYFLFFLFSFISGFLAIDYFLVFESLYHYAVLFLSLLYIINSLNSRNYSIAFKVIEITFWIQFFLGVMQFMHVEAFYLTDVSMLNDNTNINEDFGYLRAWGSFGDSLVYIAFMLPISIFFSIDYKIKKKRAPFIFYFCSCIGLLVLSSSRGALLAVIGTVLITSLFYKKFFLYFVILTLVSFIIVVSFVDLRLFESLALVDRLSSGRDEIGSGRVEIWSILPTIIMDNFIFGVGPGNLGVSLVNYGIDFAGAGNKTTHVENVFLTILITNGIIGCCYYLKIVLFPLLLCLKFLKKYKLNKSLFLPFIAFFGSSLIIMLTNPAFITNPSVNVCYLYFLVYLIYIKNAFLSNSNTLG